MNEEKLLQEEIILNLLEYINKQSKDTIENISKIINKERRKKYKENREKKLGDNSKAISEDKFNILISNTKDQRLKLIFQIMYYMGLRVSEVVLIKKNDIINNRLTINNIKAKRIETRIIPLKLNELILKYIKNNNDKISKNKYLFTNIKNSQHISKDFVRKKFKEITLKYNINEVYYENEIIHPKTKKLVKRKLYLYSTHSLRHSFAKRFYEKSKCDIEKTRIAMRHKLIKDTQTYINGDIEEVNKLMLEL